MSSAEILIVDDNAVQSATRRAILERAGRTAEVASGAAQALELLEVEGFRSGLSLVITDHCMPGMMGPDFVRELRARRMGVPVVVLSGMADAENEYEGLNVIYRIKPFPPDMLISLVASLLDTPYQQSA
ncbi:response regulator [Silvibacterium sp.]|uniref:response regulator n=1 Tax=Silvibacterium sp. TaxID=1964179 RepID=UPI0039E243DD